MRLRLPLPAGSLWFALLPSLTLVGAPRPVPQANEAPRAGDDDRTACEVNLHLIYDALQHFRHERGDWPANLSDLLPEFIYDANILLCPIDRRNWSLRKWKNSLVDPGFDPRSSYAYEFSGAPLKDDYWRGLPRFTAGQWKQRQSALLKEQGGLVPLVRCHEHREGKINLGLNGEIYPSGLYWEDKLAAGVDRELLDSAARGFADRTAPRPIRPDNFLPRPPGAPSAMLDLTDFYNAELTDGWQGFPGNDLSSLPEGVQSFDSVAFDVRGVIQLFGAEASVEFPHEVDGICVERPFKRIHVLHAATFTQRNESPRLGAYLLNYVDGQTRELPIVRGENIADWWGHLDDLAEPSCATVAWAGANEATRVYGTFLRIYHASWDNPRPEVEVTTITLVSNGRIAAPFILAITVEP